MSVLKAIRAKCMDCSGHSPAVIRECELTHCALHPYRMGKNPFRKKREFTEEQKAVMAERLARARGEQA